MLEDWEETPLVGLRDAAVIGGGIRQMTWGCCSQIKIICVVKNFFQPIPPGHAQALGNIFEGALFFLLSMLKKNVTMQLRLTSNSEIMGVILIRPI